MENENSEQNENENIKPNTSTQDQTSHSTTDRDSKQSKKQNMLFIGDSITNVLNARKIELACNANIMTVKAYSATHDVKHAARYPRKNFIDVAQLEFDKKEFDILMLQA